MNRESPLYWSIPCGNWFATQVRLSVWFPLLLMVFAYRLGWEEGLAFGGIFVLSVLFHEFGHVVGTRLTGGTANEILLWPLGGLAMVQPAPTLASQFISTLGGPAVNAILCGATLPAVIRSGNVSEVLNPFVFPALDLHNETLQAVLIMVFVANWVSLLVNLIPVYPLDGGRMMQVLLSHAWGREIGTEWYLFVGFLSAIGLLFGGMMFDSTWITAIGAVVLVLNQQELMQHRLGESVDESFMGYDFSQGYTSLERKEASAPEKRPGWLARWREQRRQEKVRRDREHAQWMEQQVDVLLNKIHEHGVDSLTSSERALLQRAGQRYREKGQQDS